MNQYRIAALVAVALLATGCNTTTKEEVVIVRDALQGSAKLRTRAYQTCFKTIQSESRSVRQDVADVINVDIDKVPSTFCNRFVKAMTEGRLSADDYNHPTRSRTMLKVLQGR